jgi:hypothetical protein
MSTTSKDADLTKRRTTIYIDDDVWKGFIEYLVEKHGKTHGGIISEEIQNAIKLMIGKGKTSKN